MFISSRRRLVAVVVALLFASAWVMACSAAPLAGTQAPGFYRFMLGDYEITVVSDGTTLRKFDEIMSDGARIREIYARDHETLPAEMSINTFLINTGSKLVLIDSGGGALLGSTLSGKLPANLGAAGYKPEQIDAVLLTHMHPDHVGGLTLNGQRQFPNAVVYANRLDTEFWLSPAAAAAAPDNRKTMFQQAHLVVDPYVSADRLRPFDGATDVFPGIRSVPSKGHTPGHTSYLVESKGQQLLLWGDIIHVSEAQFADPAMTMAFDSNRDDAAASRNELLRTAAAKGYIVGAAHISFPGLGHVRADDETFSWIPLPYSVAR